MSYELEQIKEWPIEKLAKLVRKLGGPKFAEGLISNELDFKLWERSPKLFDENGQRIDKWLEHEARKDFDDEKRLSQPIIDYSFCLSRVLTSFPDGLEFPTLEEFQSQSEKLILQLEKNWQLDNLLRGAYFPICLPRLEIDYGQSLYEIFFPAVASAHKRLYPGESEFSDYYSRRHFPVNGKVEINKYSRHANLVEKLREGPLVAIQFFPLWGFGDLSCLEQLTPLPDSLLLSGIIDIATAIITYPGILCDDKSHRYACIAVDLPYAKEPFFDSHKSTLYFAGNDSGFNGFGYCGMLYIGEQPGVEEIRRPLGFPWR